MSQRTEQLWATSKYEVMYYSQTHYNAIRQLMRTKPTYELVEQQIEEAKRQTPTEGSMRNSCDHMWGYFKKRATVEQKQAYEALKAQHLFPQMLALLKQLADEYEVTYLQQSTILNK